ncbi:MAG: hypothetical protein M0036_20530 [Desulfobacteraceae bacterium]|nr:hypothetical protein [Desulfobacteraceae bacterium]
MDFKKHLENAWRLTLKHLTSLILMTLVMFVVSAATLGILSPVMLAGYCQAIIEMIRDGREPKISDLFSQFHLFLPLLFFSLIVAVAILIGFTLLVLPGIAMVCVVVFGCLYMLPLITDQKMGILEALKKSWEMAIKENLPDHMVVVILIIGLTAMGSSVFIGTLFTQPFTTVFVLSIYLERTGHVINNIVQPPPAP